MTDVQLLDGFVRQSDPTFFDALMARHGPRVLRVCRRVLTEPNDADDACQMTFMILVQKAPELRDPDALGNWLHGVAHRVSLRMRRDLSRRRKYEHNVAAMRQSDPELTPSWDDLGRTVREELSTLPEAYRVPLELCYLRGQSHEQAAMELGWPLGTLKTRVLRGRKRLQERLDRRGISIGAGLLWLLWPGRNQASAFSTASVEPVAPVDPSAHLPAPIASKPKPHPARNWTALAAGLAAVASNPIWVSLIGLTFVFVVVRILEFFHQIEPLCG